MVATSLTSTHLSDNDIKSLASVLEASFKHFCSGYSPFAEDYLKDISTIVGLGFTAVLVDKWFVPIYHQRLQTFLDRSEFRQHEGYISLLSQYIAEMISLALSAFGSIHKNNIRYPEDFGNLIKKVLKNITVTLTGKEQEAERLLNVIFPRQSCFGNS